MNKKIFNIIVAAGSGSRFGADLPKQFCLLKNRPVLMHTIDRMQNALPLSETIIVLNKNFFGLWNDLCNKYGFTSPTVIAGGETRWHSVKNALDYISGHGDYNSIITIHDGARPLVDSSLVMRVIHAAERNSGAIPAISVTDSLRYINDDGTSSAADRSRYRAVQTPQAFQAEKLLFAYSRPYQTEFTDDASVMTAAGYADIILVEGSSTNIKITLPHDIDIAEIYMSNQ